MKLVVDTNVVAYFLLGTEPFATECRNFWSRVDKTAAPSSWQIEIINVLWMAVRKKVITPSESLQKLRLAAGLAVQPVPVRQLWRGALVRSIRSGIPAYDTVFVELAARRNLRLATFDTHLLRAFPEIAGRPSAL